VVVVGKRHHGRSGRSNNGRSRSGKHHLRLPLLLMMLPLLPIPPPHYENNYVDQRVSILFV
jgi:hypothetical protein